MNEHDYELMGIREKNLRDPLAHADALFNIEQATKEMSQATERLANNSEDQLELIKDRYQDLSNYLLNFGSHQPLLNVTKALNHIKIILLLILLLLFVHLLK